MTGHRDDWTGATAREAVWWRQGGLCALCWQHMGPLESDDWEAHHRVRRRDLPGWCPCNIVGLHARCHTQGPQAVHDHPEAARDAGLILAGGDPRLHALEVRYPWQGLAYLDCDGMVVSPGAAPEVVEGVQGALPFTT